MRSIFWASGVSAMRWIPVGASADRIAHQREQAGMPGAGAEHAIRVKAQGAFADIVRQNVEIDAADLGEIARRQRAGDRLGGVPPLSARAPCAGRRPRRLRPRSRDNRAVPIVDDVARLAVFQALDPHQPVDMIATGAAAEAIIVIGIDPHARLCFAVERAQDHAAARHRQSIRSARSISVSSSGGGVWRRRCSIVSAGAGGEHTGSDDRGLGG